MDFVAIDVETANADPASICQIGVARYVNGRLDGEWKSLINPEADFNATNVGIHGITARMVRDAPTFPQAIPTLRKWLVGQTAVCHTSFDRIAIQKALARYRLPGIGCRWLDTAQVARRTWDWCASQGYGLKDVCRALNYGFQHHDALADAKASAYILLKASEHTGLDIEGWLKRLDRPIIPDSPSHERTHHREEMAMSTRGIRYSCEVHHAGLGKHRIITGTDRTIVERKAALQTMEWELAWRQKQQKEQIKTEKAQAAEAAAERTREAQQALDTARALLAHTLDVDDAIDWDALQDHTSFQEPTPPKPSIPPEPKADDSRYQPKLGLLDYASKTRRQARIDEAKALYEREHQAWEAHRDEMVAAYERNCAQWERDRAAFLAEQTQKNQRIEERRQQYLAKDPGAIVDYCDMVLARSQYPDWISPSFELDYVADTGTLVVDYQLPAIDNLPRLKEVKYVQSRGEFKETAISASELNHLYDSVLYQIVLRTVHELFEADRADALAAVVLNGWVTATDRSTGQEATVCVLSLHTTKPAFLAINLARVDPKACFKSLKGVGSSKLFSLTPVAPLMQINKEDRRFVQAHGVADDLDEGYNLATMPWEDFEHLTREIFEKEFAQHGGEVKVTQASRDGGVDAVAFDPDPIRGGKLVIQAKRYTKTVGVSAVRDLYGTVLNEGATKGILVTTADFGPDAYEFAQGKPLTLLNGANLLYLLEKHGYKVRIDLKEARAEAGNG